MSRWKAICDRRGGGWQVQERGATTTNANDGGGAVGYRGETKRSIKPVDTGGEGRLK